MPLQASKMQVRSRQDSLQAHIYTRCGGARAWNTVRLLPGPNDIPENRKGLPYPLGSTLGVL